MLFLRLAKSFKFFRLATKLQLIVFSVSVFELRQDVMQFASNALTFFTKQYFKFFLKTSSVFFEKQSYK